tara:strand:+ start:111 stop:389 length:279 start_codon:yes stop_codon:yes gene_type:complete
MSDNFKRLSYIYNVQFENSRYKFPDYDMTPYDSDHSKKVDKEISELLKNGWSIASTSPVTATSIRIGSSADGGTKQFTYTIAIEVFMVKTNV